MKQDHKKWGGKRQGQTGRPRKIWPTADECMHELLLPCVVAAFKDKPDLYGDRTLTFELSKTDLLRAYGPAGFAAFSRFFKLKKRGGANTDGVGFPSRWAIYPVQYTLAKALIESMGHSLKDLPDIKCPSDVMLARVEAANKRAELRRQKKNESPGTSNPA